jgi:hypothetical protein
VVKKGHKSDISNVYGCIEKLRRWLLVIAAWRLQTAFYCEAQVGQRAGYAPNLRQIMPQYVGALLNNWNPLCRSAQGGGCCLFLLSESKRFGLFLNCTSSR